MARDIQYISEIMDEAYLLTLKYINIIQDF